MHEPCHLLYVEDEKEILEAYAKMLQRNGYDICTAQDGLDAWRRYLEHSPDILIVDIVIPQLDGLSLLEKIREKDLFTRIILLTAHRDDDKLIRAAELGITRYLVKPVRKAMLLEAIKTARSQLDRLKHNPRRFLPPHSLELTEDSIDWETILKTLTKNETILLNILAADRKRFHSLEEIENHFFMDYDKDVTPQSIKATIKRLRKKLPEKAIENRFGHGYRLTI